MFNILWELGAKIKMFIQGLLTFITTWTLSLWRGPHMISSQKKKPHHGASPCFHLGRSLCVNIFNVLKIDGCKPCSIMIQFEIEWHSEVFWMIVKGHQDLKKETNYHAQSVAHCKSTIFSIVGNTLHQTFKLIMFQKAFKLIVRDNNHLIIEL